MLTYALGFVQNVQLVCFALVFGLMALRDRENLSLRWLALSYLAAISGGLIQTLAAFFPTAPLVPWWLLRGIAMEGIPAAYVCVHLSLIHFVGGGARTRWISFALLAGSLPFYLLWARIPHSPPNATLNDLVLALQTTLTAWLLFSTVDEETLWPRRVMGGFLMLYASVELLRVVVFLRTHQLPATVEPSVELASGFVYVVSCSIMPLALIWMFNLRLNAHLNRQALSDPLTGVPNRRGLEDAGVKAVARYLRSRQNLSVVLLDLDFFKMLNDNWGHAAGDSVLRGTASLLRSFLRESDTLGRLGGEEFVLILPNTTQPDALHITERIRKAIEDHAFRIRERRVAVTASFGIAVSDNRPSLSWNTLLNEADLALYAAKHAGRNTCMLYQEMLHTPSGIFATENTRAAHLQKA